MLPAKLPSKQLQVIWYSVINSIIHQWWSGKCYCLLPKYLYLTRTWLKKYLMYLMSSKYSEYLNLYLYLQIWKSTCTWLKYFEKYLTPTLLSTSEPVLLESFWSDSDVPIRARINSWIELELIINSIQFTMNWIGIELKDFELELNWNWKPELIGIDQFNQFIFNSTPHFIRLNIFLYAILWKL